LFATVRQRKIFKLHLILPDNAVWLCGGSTERLRTLSQSTQKYSLDNYLELQFYSPVFFEKEAKITCRPRTVLGFSSLCSAK